MIRRGLRGPGITVALALAEWGALSFAAAEGPDPRSIIEQSIEFHGGRSALRNLPDVKAVGISERSGRSGVRTIDVVVYERSDGGRRLESTSEIGGRKRTSIEIFDGTTCKRSAGGGWDDLPIDENRERAAHRVSILLDALERDPVSLGAGADGGIDVWRVGIADGAGRAVLSLARDDARLVAIEYEGTEAEGMGTKKTVSVKLIHRALREVDGVRLPTDTETQLDGAVKQRVRLQTLERIERWDDEWLRVPDPRRRFIPTEELAN